MGRLFAKEVWNFVQSLPVTSEVGNAVAKRRIFYQPFKKFSIPDLNCSRNSSSTIAKLRTGHFRSMEISPDDYSRYYAFCGNIPDTELTSDHIFEYQIIIACLFQLDEPPQDILYSLPTPDQAAHFFNAFGSIEFSLTYGHNNNKIYFEIFHF